MNKKESSMSTEDKLAQALRIFTGAAYPVDRRIDPRGHNWSQAYLDGALAEARAAIAEYDSAQASKASGDSTATKLTPDQVVAIADAHAAGDWTDNYVNLIREVCDAALAAAHPTERQGQKPEAVALDRATTEAYAEGRGDQYEDDCAVVRLLFENLDDVDVMDDGRINTTRVRELLSHFDLPRSVECSGIECTRPECGSMGCTADRINTCREQRVAAVVAQAAQLPSPPQAAPDRVGGGDV